MNCQYRDKLTKLENLKNGQIYKNNKKIVKSNSIKTRTP